MDAVNAALRRLKPRELIAPALADAIGEANFHPTIRTAVDACGGR